MSIIQEQHLIQNLSHFYVMSHLFNKYTNALPKPEFILELLGKKLPEESSRKIIAHPVDPRIRRIFVEPDDRNPDNVREFTVTFNEKVLPVTECIEHYGGFVINFYPDNMLTEFSFSQFRSIFIEQIGFRVKGKFTENEDGSFTFIHPHTFERTVIAREDLKFSSFTFRFRQMGGF